MSHNGSVGDYSWGNDWYNMCFHQHWTDDKKEFRHIHLQIKMLRVDEIFFFCIKIYVIKF